MLDTDICVHIIRSRPPEIISRLVEHDAFEIGVSAITHSELEYGICKSARPEKNRSALIQFLSPFEIAPYDDLAAATYGEIRADLERRGKTIGSMDMLIAAHARSLGCTLVTNNTREFGRVPGLSLENWVR